MLTQIHAANGQTLNLDSTYFYEVNQKEFLQVENLSGENGLVVIFTSSFCPYCSLYEERILQVKSQYDSLGINFVLVNSNNSVGINIETIEGMRTESKRLGISYVSDQNHAVMNALQATKNPEIIVLRPIHGGFEKAYQGSVDDSPKDSDSVSEEYLKMVLDNLVRGMPSPIKRTHPVGCRIR